MGQVEIPGPVIPQGLAERDGEGLSPTLGVAPAQPGAQSCILEGERVRSLSITAY